MTETGILISAFKAIVVFSILTAASISDLRTRRVSDRYWIALILAGSVAVLLEMIEQGGGDSPITFLSLSLPGIGLVFVTWGYPELDKALKGEKTDIFFTFIYALLLAGSVAALVFGNRVLAGKVLLSFIFMAIYFAIYTWSFFGTRLIHGGADAKCMMSLAALYPWYGSVLPISYGPFYETLEDMPLLEYASPVHLGVLVNAAFVTAIIMLAYIPTRNIIAGTFHPLRSWTSYEMDVEKTRNSQVWILTEGEGNERKHDPEPKLIRSLKAKGIGKVRVTPKIPFILSLTLGFLLQVLLGNLIFALMFAL